MQPPQLHREWPALLRADDRDRHDGNVVANRELGEPYAPFLDPVAVVEPLRRPADPFGPDRKQFALLDEGADVGARAAHDAEAREQRARERQPRDEMVGYRPRNPRRIHATQDVQAHHRGIDREHSAMIRDEDRRTGGRYVLDPLGVHAEVPVVGQSPSADRGRKGRWMQAEQVIAMAGIVERCLSRKLREGGGVHRLASQCRIRSTRGRRSRMRAPPARCLGDSFTRSRELVELCERPAQGRECRALDARADLHVTVRASRACGSSLRGRPRHGEGLQPRAARAPQRWMTGPLREAEAVMKRILVALDGSPRAPKVLDAAARLAELAGGKLVLYRAITVSPDLPRAVLVETNRRLEDILVANAREDLAHSAAHLPPEFVEKTVTAFAIPWDGICRAARECDADLIVIGSHGYSGIDRILGTTAGKVVNHADRNVLVVRNSLQAQRPAWRGA